MTSYTKAEALDDPEFLAWVERVIAGVETRFETDQCYVVKIDNWFGQRWLGFSGKSLGAFGWCNARLTLPPFVPSRVVSQSRFLWEGARPGPQQRLHLWQRSSENFHRYADILVREASAFWYSGATKENNRASFMAYVLTPEGHWPWYIGLRKKELWHVVEALGISRSELDLIREPRPDIALIDIEHVVAVRELLDDLRAFVRPAEDGAELTRLLVVELEHGRGLVVLGAPEDVELARAVEMLDDGDAAPVAGGERVLRPDTGQARLSELLGHGS